MGVLLWLVALPFVWIIARRGKRRLEAKRRLLAYALSSALTGLYLAYTFAPGAVSGGFVAIPLPAVAAVALESLDPRRGWSDIRPNVVSFAVSVAVITIVHFPFACASRRGKERDRAFDAARRKA
jgi:hypothetical protein